MAFHLMSTAFEQGQEIPKKYTADGRNISPPLKWNEPPAATKSFAMICEDPDAPRGTFTHWVAFKIPPDTRQLEEGSAVGVQASNDFRKTGYAGPSPPPGKPHRYFFKLYALDRELDLAASASKNDLLS